MELRDISQQDPGRRLREVRERLGLKYRDVQEATQAIAQARGNRDFVTGLSRLADIENHGTVPSIYRLYSLAAVYGLSLKTVLGWYGIPLVKLPFDTARLSHRHTRIVEADHSGKADTVVVGDIRSTIYSARALSDGGPFPLALTRLQPNRRYAVIGTDDWSMYPLLHPGAFIQIDDKRRKPEAGPWSSEGERPIYLVESRIGYQAAWCTLRRRELLLQFHPCSGMEPARLNTPDEAEIVGQVIGVAMNLDSAKRRRTRS